MPCQNVYASRFGENGIGFGRTALSATTIFLLSQGSIFKIGSCCLELCQYSKKFTGKYKKRMPTIRVELITLSCQVFTSDTLYRLAKRALVYLEAAKMKLFAFHNRAPQMDKLLDAGFLWTLLQGGSE